MREPLRVFGAALVVWWTGKERDGNADDADLGGWTRIFYPRSGGVFGQDEQDLQDRTGFF